ncbi:MAG TPA: aminotransferase class V-fold PLP-dependent enzyme [Thermoanaerobaculia bacterium]|jgi:isopenicillin-N epimerase|nr:aminotransferase class V-fold PLP-dependent enzyme [Thermoanaerobaculia bacterium]
MPSDSPFAREWTIDPSVDFLNHGCYGACPRAVLERQAELRAEMERQPLEFLSRRLPRLFDEAREALAEFVGADAAGMVAVPNATTGVSTVLRALETELGPGDELLTTDHAYNACKNAIDWLAARSGAKVVVARVPFPLGDAAEVVEAVLGGASERTRVALIDHITSPTALVLPVAEIIAALAARGIDTLVDGAHAPGQVALDVRGLGAAWYTGNCHKWICSPKVAAFLWAREDKRDALRPLVVSHGHNVRRPGRSRLHDEFDWQGTGDPTPFLCVPEAIRVIGAMVPGGWDEVRSRNHELALAGRRLVAEALEVELPCPDAMIGSMAALPLQPGPRPGADQEDPLHDALLARYRIEVPVQSWPGPPGRALRISAQLHNELAQYERLAAALRELAAVEAREVLLAG